MANRDPAHEYGLQLDAIAILQGNEAAVNIATSMLVAATATLIQKRGAAFAYAFLQQAADDIALQIIARSSDFCGNED